MWNRVELSHLSPIASGALRRVYVHPRDPELLVKVIRPDTIERRWGKSAKWYKTRRRYRQYVAVVREVQEYLAAYAVNNEPLYFIQKIVGFVDTDLGLGFVTRAVRARDGNYAPSLAALIQNGRYNEEVERAFAKFARDFVESSVVIGDFTPGNLVYGYDETYGDHFVLIDGLGSSTLIPLKTHWAFANRLSKQRQIKRITGKIQSLLAKSKNG